MTSVLQLNLIYVRSALLKRGNKYIVQIAKNAGRYNLRKFSFCSRVVNIWNSLPDSVVDADTINTIKRRLE